MRLPWKLIRRDEHDLLLEKIGRQLTTLKERDRALSKLGHARDKAYRDCAELVRDLRVIRLHIEGHPYAREGRVGISFELADAVILDSYRRRGTFHEVLGYMIEDAMMRSPEGRSLLIGGPRV